MPVRGGRRLKDAEREIELDVRIRFRVYGKNKHAEEMVGELTRRFPQGEIIKVWIDGNRRTLPVPALDVRDELDVLGGINPDGLTPNAEWRIRFGGGLPPELRRLGVGSLPYDGPEAR